MFNSLITRFTIGRKVGPHFAKSLYCLYKDMSLKDVRDLEHFKDWSDEEINHYFRSFLYPVYKTSATDKTTYVRALDRRQRGSNMAYGLMVFGVSYLIGYLATILVIIWFIVKIFKGM